MVPTQTSDRTQKYPEHPHQPCGTAVPGHQRLAHGDTVLREDVDLVGGDVNAAWHRKGIKPIRSPRAQLWRNCPPEQLSQCHWRTRTRTNQGMGGSRVAVFRRCSGQSSRPPESAPPVAEGDRSLLLHLSACRTRMSRARTHRSSGCCSFYVSVCLPPSLFALAGVAVFSTAVATTGRGVQWRGCWAVEGSHWKTQLLVSAVRQGGG